MKVAKGYKQTEIGIIPSDWEVQKLKRVCKLINGRGFKPHEWRKEGLPIIRIQNLNGSEDFNYYKGAFHHKILVEKGQLLFAWSGSRGTSFGPHIWNGKKALLNYHTWKVNVAEQKIDKGFFLHLLKQLTKRVEEKAHGASALVHTQKGEMENFEFVFPSSKAEQKEIASKLSDVDSLVSTMEKMIDKKEKLKLGTMQALLSGKKRLKPFEGKWIVRLVGDVSTVSRGRVISHREISNSFGGVYPVYSSQTSDNGIMGYINTYDFEGEYLTWTTDGANAGKVFYRNGKFNCTNVCGTIKLKADHAPFVALMLDSVTSKYVSKHLANPKLMNDTMKKIEIQLPEMGEQIAIAKVINDFDAEIEGLRKQLSKYKLLKQAMMQNLLTGKIRLISNN